MALSFQLELLLPIGGEGESELFNISRYLLYFNWYFRDVVLMSWGILTVRVVGV